MSKFTSVIIKLIVAAVALAGCVYAVTCYWDDLMQLIHAGRKLYCHERSRRGHGYRNRKQKTYEDLELDQSGI